MAGDTQPWDAVRVALVGVLADRYAEPGAALAPFYEEGDRAIYRVDRLAGEPWVLRLFERTRPLARIEGDATVLRYLAAHGVPAERLVEPIDGSGATSFDGHGVLVTKLVRGSRPDRRPETLRRLGDALGRLHTLPPPPPTSAHLARRAGAEPAEDLAAARRWLADVADRARPTQQAELERIAAAIEATDACAGLPQRLTHNDRHLGNSIQTPTGDVVLVDWEGAGQGTLVAAIGWLLFSCAVAAPEERPGEVVLERVDPVLEGYCRHRSPTADEIARLADAVRIRPLVVAARTLARSIAAGAPPEPGFAWSAHYTMAETVACRAKSVLATARATPRVRTPPRD
jgi:Ser/Thr protein kinase RdoA (MazF antagonist)